MPRVQNRRHADDDDEDIDSSQSRDPRKKPRPARRAQSEGDDEDEDNDEEGAAHGRRREQSAGEDDEDEEDDERAQKQLNELLENFTNQPLPPDSARKLGGLIADWNNLTNKIEHIFPAYNETGAVLAEQMAQDDGKEPQMLDDAFRALIDARGEIKANQEAMKGLQSSLESGRHMGSLTETYEKETKKVINQYLKKTTRQKYASDPSYISFRERVYEAGHDGKGMDPLSQTMPREEDDSDDSDDDLVIGGATQDYKCPLSLTLFKDPVTSICKHSFSKESILQYIGSAGNKCPSAGCSQLLRKEDLTPNPDLAARVKAHERRLRQQQELRQQETEEVLGDSD